jgi:hypothetical protein
MAWLVLSYSLPAQSRSSPRVTVWRRLKQLGAVAAAGGAQVLPARDACEEAFQWLAQEIRQAKGEAVAMRVEQFTGLTDGQLIDLFQAARAADYAELETELKQLEQALKTKDRFRLAEALERLRRKHAAIAQIDYFESPAGALLAARLAKIERALAPAPPASVITTAALAEYQDKRWVTRPQPHVDRLACSWLIRRFINPHAVIRYSLRPEPAEVTFDMEPAVFGHQGNLCSFETMRLAFGLDDPGLRTLAEIVHDIDLQDNQFGRPETHGVAAVLNGWRLSNLTDTELETRGLSLFEGLYVSILGRTTPAPRRVKKAR